LPKGGGVFFVGENPPLFFKSPHPESAPAIARVLSIKGGTLVVSPSLIERGGRGRFKTKEGGDLEEEKENVVKKRFLPSRLRGDKIK